MPRLWSSLLAACNSSDAAAAAAPAPGGDAGMATDEATAPIAPLVAHTVCVQGRGKLWLTLLPPPQPRASPMAVVELARAAEVVLVAVPGQPAGGGGNADAASVAPSRAGGGARCGGGARSQGALPPSAAPHPAIACLERFTAWRRRAPLSHVCACRGDEEGEGGGLVDAQGRMALSVLRSMGLPEVVLAVQGCGAPGSMKDRSAAKRRAEKAVGAVLAGVRRAPLVHRPPSA